VITKTFVVDGRVLHEVVAKHAQKLGYRCGRPVLDLLTERYKAVEGSTEDGRYSYVWRNAIEDHERDSQDHEARGAIVSSLRDATLGAIDRNYADVEEFLTSLLESSHEVLARIGIYVCGQRFDVAGKLFVTHLKASWFSELGFWHESYWVVKSNFRKFGAIDQAYFIALVMSLKGEWIDGSDASSLDEQLRRDVLSAAVGQGNQVLDAEYRRLIDIHGKERPDIDFHTFTSEASWVGEKSPATAETILRMSDAALTKLLATFTEDRGNWQGPTIKGLADAIAAAVRLSDDGFATRLTGFLEQPTPYQHGLLRGLKNRWSEDKNDIHWDAVVSVVESIVSSDRLRREIDGLGNSTGGVWTPDARWLISDVADLIKEGSSTDRSMPAELLVRCMAILSSLIDLSPPSSTNDPASSVSTALNSNHGQLVISSIHVALAMAREGDPLAPEVAWNYLKPLVEKELVSSEEGDNSAFAAICGLYCVNLHFLAPQWVDSNFSRMFSQKNVTAWRSAAFGFSYQSHMYEWLYIQIRKGGHLQRMIFDEAGEQVRRKALQFLTLAYLEKREDINSDGPLKDLIRTLQDDSLKQICWFLWTLRDNAPSDEREERIVDLWISIWRAIRDSGVEHRSLSSQLNLLSVFVTKLDDPNVVAAWSDSAQYAEIGHHGNVTVASLARLVRSFPSQVAGILIQVVGREPPMYKVDDLRYCVLELYEAGLQEEAELVCNRYAEMGSNALHATYDEIRLRAKSGGAT
jgi:hypothetical protein